MEVWEKICAIASILIPAELKEQRMDCQMIKKHLET